MLRPLRRKAVFTMVSRMLVRWKGRYTTVLVMLTVVVAAGAVRASPATAVEPTGDFAVFEQCPRFTSGVELCLYAETLTGELVLDRESVPISKALVVQGGLKINSETGAESLVGALNGETIVRTAEKVPGGLLGLVNCGTLPLLMAAACEAVLAGGATGVDAITELAKPADDAEISTENLEEQVGVALGLPVKIRLENPLLGNDCYIGSASSPVALDLTDSVTTPQPPNRPIHGTEGRISVKDNFQIVDVTNNTLVNNEFAAPAAAGCGGPFAPVIDPIIDARIGLPAPDGFNTAIEHNFLQEGEASAVVASER